MHGVDVFHPGTGEVRSDGPEGIACWFVDTDYNQESFFVRHAYFLGAGDPYKSLKTTLKAEIDADAWATLNRATSTMTLLLGALAGVSLIVGGVGIMNVMLLAVTERTREIGLRLAVGARRRDVLFQFLTEAIALAVLGGLVGIGAGAIASMLVEEALGWPTMVHGQAAAAAAVLAVGVGVFFGWYPARRASRLDPIVALRTE